MQFSLHRWIRISLLNLLIVASIGVVLRYKIAFALPFIDQKFLLHGHSHFAFTGWITQSLMLLLVGKLANEQGMEIFRRYRPVLIANLISAYGMLICFPIEGYGLYSIIFSTLSILVSYFFAVMYWKDMRKLKTRNTSHSWISAALLFNVISSIGAFALAGMMIAKFVHQNWYLAAEYFYLHFQYNGWFFFSCMGLFTGKLASSSIPEKSLKNIYRLFASAAVPAYLLSVLWVNLSMPLYIIVVMAAFAQVIAWGWFVLLLRKNISFLLQTFSRSAKWLFILSAIALSIKLFLQLGSVIPSLSDLSYGFRPIIIGYLHLVLLGIITLFILGYFIAEENISFSRLTFWGAGIFTAGIIINEILLMIQGVKAMNYENIPYITEALFATALVMFSGILLVNCSVRKKIIQT